MTDLNQQNNDDVVNDLPEDRDTNLPKWLHGLDTTNSPDRRDIDETPQVDDVSFGLHPEPEQSGWVNEHNDEDQDEQTQPIPIMQDMDGQAVNIIQSMPEVEGEAKQEWNEVLEQANLETTETNQSIEQDATPAMPVDVSSQNDIVPQDEEAASVDAAPSSRAPLLEANMLYDEKEPNLMQINSDDFEDVVPGLAENAALPEMLDVQSIDQNFDSDTQEEDLPDWLDQIVQDQEQENLSVIVNPMQTTEPDSLQVEKDVYLTDFQEISLVNIANEKIITKSDPEQMSELSADTTKADKESKEVSEQDAKNQSTFINIMEPEQSEISTDVSIVDDPELTALQQAATDKSLLGIITSVNKLINQEEHLDVAAQTLTFWLTENPDSPEAWEMLGDVCMHQNKIANAVEAYIQETRLLKESLLSCHLTHEEVTLERSLVLIKPDGVQRGLIGEIISRFEQRGLRLIGAKFIKVSQELAETHYAIHLGKPFYEPLIKFIISAPVMAMVWEGPQAIEAIRQTVGKTRGTEADPGTIRHDFALQVQFNLVHASDSPETATQEIALWFRENELVDWRRDLERWMYE